jgi:hypothetical protein
VIAAFVRLLILLLIRSDSSIEVQKHHCGERVSRVTRSPQWWLRSKQPMELA